MLNFRISQLLTGPNATLNTMYPLTVIFQFGLAVTLLAWAVIHSVHTRSRVYGVLAVTLLCLLVRLLLTNAMPDADVPTLDAASQILHTCALLAFSVNFTYLLHLVLADSQLQHRRQGLIVWLYVAALLTGLTVCLTQQPWLAGIFFIANGGVLLLVCSDLWLNLIKRRQLTQIQRWQLAVVYAALMGLVFHLFSALTPETRVNSLLTLAELADWLWIPMAFLLMNLLTVVHQQSFKSRCNQANLAQQQADTENTLRLNQQRFLSMLMHEIRTPLSVIKIGTEAILDAAPEGRVKNNWSQRIDIAIDNITQVIDNCVQAEKHDAGLIQPHLSRFVAEEEIAAMISQIAAANPEFSKRIRVAIEKGRHHGLLSDKHYVQSILMNLISNALKYSPPLSLIYLRMTEFYGENQHCLKFEIESTLGKAGAPDPSQLFQRYYRAEAAKKYAGTGLGLWLSQTLAKQLGTRIHMVMSNQQTVIFYFNLPLLHDA